MIANIISLKILHYNKNNINVCLKSGDDLERIENIFISLCLRHYYNSSLMAFSFKICERQFQLISAKITVKDYMFEDSKDNLS